LTPVSVAEQPDFKARDNSAEISTTPKSVSAETTAPTEQPASSGPFAQSGKFASSKECVVADAGCPYRKSNPRVLMVQAAENRAPLYVSY
jgi:hypothetical protein